MLSISAVFVFFCLAVCVADAFFRRVFNWLLILGIAAQTLSLVFRTEPDRVVVQEWMLALVGAILGLIFMLGFYALRVMGAGDVKFFAVLGFWLGPAPLLSVWVLGSVLAGLHVLVMLASRHAVGQWLTVQWGTVQQAAEQVSLVRQIGDWIASVRGGRRGIPYAAYLAAAAIAVTYWR